MRVRDCFRERPMSAATRLESPGGGTHRYEDVLVYIYARDAGCGARLGA